MTATAYQPRPGSTAEAATAYLLGRGWVEAGTLADGIECEPASGLHAGLSTAVTHGFFVKRINGAGRAEFDLASEIDADEPVQIREKAHLAEVPKPMNIFQAVAATVDANIAAERKLRGPRAAPAPAARKAVAGSRKKAARAEGKVAKKVRAKPGPKPGPKPVAKRAAKKVPKLAKPAKVKPRAAKVQRKAAKPEQLVRIGTAVVERLEEAPAARKFACGLFNDGRLVLELENGTDQVLSVDATRTLCDFLDTQLGHLAKAA